MSDPKYHMEDIFRLEDANPDESHAVQMRLIPPGSRVLELGCASGYMAGFLEQERQCRVTGLEYDPASAAVAAQRCSEVHVVDLDAPDALGVAEGSAPYDVVYAANVLEHLKHPEQVLQGVHSLLTAEGLLLVVLPNIAHWGARLRLLRGRFEYTDYGLMDRTHVHFYTVPTGRRLLEDNGFRVQDLHIAGSFLQNMLNKLARRMGRALPPPVLPNLLAYEMIFVARKP